MRAPTEESFSLDALVATVDVVDAVDECFALCDQRGRTSEALARRSEAITPRARLVW